MQTCQSKATVNKLVGGLSFSGAWYGWWCAEPGCSDALEKPIFEEDLPELLFWGGLTLSGIWDFCFSFQMLFHGFELL